MVISSQKNMSSELTQETSSNNPIIENNPEKSTDSEDSFKVKTQTSNSLFNHLKQENKIFTKRTAGGSIKLFYYYTGDEPLEIQLEEGNINDYQIHTIGGQNYYPLILGSDEAAIMRQENLFNNIGDPIKNFYGKNVVVMGVMKKLDNALDMINIIPLNSRELN